MSGKRKYERKPGRTNFCTARKTNGDPCMNAPINGANVCRFHGGSAPQVKAAARRRLEEAADRMARELLRMAGDEGVSDNVKLAAIKDALDRAGVSARTAVDVTVDPKPWEQVFASMAAGDATTTSPGGGSRAESRARRAGIDPNSPEVKALIEARAKELLQVRTASSLGEATSEPTPLRAREDMQTVIDAEVVEERESEAPSSRGADSEPLEHACKGCGGVFPDTLPPWLTEYPEYCRDCRAELGLLDAPQAAADDDADGSGYVSMEEAVALIRRSQTPRRNLPAQR